MYSDYAKELTRRLFPTALVSEHTGYSHVCPASIIVYCIRSKSAEREEVARVIQDGILDPDGSFQLAYSLLRSLQHFRRRLDEEVLVKASNMPREIQLGSPKVSSPPPTVLDA
mmetsp:Transcript_7189/g.18764  ORF Transcript_7189/g.18764 Transcript_7189/m.18764 type:complete len:113 (+) Transcript_7189:244-582(+)